MDEAEKYQQRLQAIAERRRLQEEEERLRRETDEERLKLAQKKRKSLRDQWLSERAPAPALPSLASLRPHPLLQDRADKHTAEEQTKSQKTPEEDEEEAADVRKEEDQVSQEENKESVTCTATASTHNHYQAGTEEEAQVSRAAESHFSVQMTQRMFHESGQDGRSVLGMVAVQVERDPKTGATVIRSVAPMSAPAGTAMATTVFDDGRKSVHAVGGSGGQPSAEELGQILSAIDGVGMKALLDDVMVTPPKGEIKIENAEDNRTSEGKEGKVLSYSTHHALSQENNMHLESSGGHELRAELGIEGCAESMGEEEDEQEERSMVLVREVAGKVDNMEDQRMENRMEEGPVTLMFLGYTDAASDQDQSVGQEDYGGMLTVERVIITDEGEEKVLGPLRSASSQSSSASGPGLHSSSQGLKDSVVSGADRNVNNGDLGGEAGKESQEEGFQDIPLDGNGAGVKVQGEEADKGLHNSASPSKAEGEGTPKRKTCQCCSVM